MSRIKYTCSFFLLITHNRKEKALSRACHHWWCFALFTGLFVCCIFSQEEKDYSSSSSKLLFLNTSRNNSISSFELIVPPLSNRGALFHKRQVKNHTTPNL